MSASETSGNGTDPRQHTLHDVRKRHPKVLEALLTDAKVAAAYRGERFRFDSRLDGVIQAVRLMLVTDSFAAQAAYRAKARLQSLGVPVLPYVMHRLALLLGNVSIGDPVLLHPGVYIPHGDVVIDGFSEVHEGAILSAWVTVGLIGNTYVGPKIGPRARIGTGAKVLGQIEIGTAARVTANSVVLTDVPDDTTAAGNPAKAVQD